MVRHRICPECQEPAAAEDALACPEHGLFLVSPTAVARLAAAPLLGQRLDEKYGLIDVVGSGSYGTVYRAVQLPLGRHVAVKVLHDAAFAHKALRERFVREAQALSRLTSPHTVRLLDFGVTRGGPVAFRNLPYIVMELLEGEPLEVYIQRGPLSRAEIGLVVQGVTESLAEAHAQGIVHRDLKPANVLLTRDHDGRLVPHLIDFGIARLDDATRSASGFVTGTPTYMSPEQARGESEIGPAADQYALAAMAFELLEGRPPFEGADIATVLTKHCTAPPPPLSLNLGGRAAAALEAALHRALSKRPAERFESVRDFRDAFLVALRGLDAPSEPAKAPAAVEAVTLIHEPMSPLLFKAPAVPRGRVAEAPTLALDPIVSPKGGRREPRPDAALETSDLPSARRSQPGVWSRPAVVWSLAAAVLGAAAAGAVVTWAWPSDSADGREPKPDPRLESKASMPDRIPATPPPNFTASHLAGVLALIDQELDLCRCDAARGAAALLGGAGFAGTVSRGIGERLEACRPVDATHQCVSGRLVEVRRP